MRRLLLAVIAAVIAAAGAAQERDEAGTPGSAASEPPGPPDIIVRGRRIGELRLEIQRAEDSVFARFNEINSTDDFDIHCRSERFYGLRRRSCLSNSWREQADNITDQTVRAMRGSPDASAVLRFTAEQQRMHRLLTAELRQLTSEDEQLRAAVDKLTAAQLELALRLGNETLFRQVTAASGSLPYDAALLFEVVMGNEPWSHRLTQHTFTIANVYGNVRHLTVECAEGRRRIDYEIGVDWTIPRDWTACMLQVHAKKATTFRLYEF